MSNKYQGFQPKSFVSRRGVNRDRFVHDALHRAEDYMDDEDFSEFGIAPKKIRITGGFSAKDDGINRITTTNLLGSTSNESIGEKILRSISGNAYRRARLTDVEDLSMLVQKTDYHGLGYKPLKSRTPHSKTNNPLEATLKHGRKLKISGEAFGVGVLDDDDDDLHHIDEYGYDNIANYKFEDKSRTSGSGDRQSRYQESTQGGSSSSFKEPHALDDFVLATDLSAMQICENESTKYPLPTIADEWKQPKRDEPYIPPENLEPKQDVSLYKSQASKFNSKFTSSISSKAIDRDTFEKRTGLIHYSDLKASEFIPPKNTIDPAQSPNQSKITIERRVIEWRPCSLLCKHFNVPNPYPDNAYFGVKPADLAISDESISAERERHRLPLAPVALRRSIFNVVFDEPSEDADDETDLSEDEPQVVMIDDTEESCIKPSGSKTPPLEQHNVVESDKSDKESDIILIDAPKQEPEVIVLSSSSSSPSSPASQAHRPRVRTQSDSESDDAYGPPLPPSRIIYKALDRKSTTESSSTSRSRSFKHKKKSKKHKRSRDRK
uniref:G patch domain-containing protein n=1 Tax=Aceria tosichella TaxID=561515 RepID=A0A6G1SGG8_9ACAR